MNTFILMFKFSVYYTIIFKHACIIQSNGYNIIWLFSPVVPNSGSYNILVIKIFVVVSKKICLYILPTES